MEKFSISFTLGKAASQHGANIKHNNRKFTAANVDERRIADKRRKTNEKRNPVVSQ